MAFAHDEHAGRETESTDNVKTLTFFSEIHVFSMYSLTDSSSFQDSELCMSDTASSYADCVLASAMRSSLQTQMQRIICKHVMCRKVSHTVL